MVFRDATAAREVQIKRGVSLALKAFSGYRKRSRPFDVYSSASTCSAYFRGEGMLMVPRRVPADAVLVGRYFQPPASADFSADLGLTMAAADRDAALRRAGE
jgi:hypothetical protein